MYILFDIGASKMRVAVTEDREHFSEPKIIKTPEHFEEGMKLFASLVVEVSGGRAVEGAAGDVSGTWSKEGTHLTYSPNIPDWVGKPLRERLEQAVGAKVTAKNDAAVVGLGEAHFGAGKGFPIVVYITVSTGVGGARITNGTIDPYAFGFEPGQQIIDITRSHDPRHNYAGTLEGFIGGNSFVNRFGKTPKELRDKVIWDELAEELSAGLYNSILHWSPDVVVLGGSMITGDPRIPVEQVKRYLYETMKVFPALPEIKVAELGDVGGLYGALTLLKQVSNS